jgi:hypothetical protein
MAGEADHGGPANLRIHLVAAFPWRMRNRHARDCEITTVVGSSARSQPAGLERAGAPTDEDLPDLTSPDLLLSGNRGPPSL